MLRCIPLIPMLMTACAYDFSMVSSGSDLDTQTHSVFDSESSTSDTGQDTDPDTGEDTGWVNRSVPYASGAASSAVLTDGLHYLGGSNSFVSETIYQEHDVYDPVSQTWKSSPTNIPDGDAWGAGAHVYENRLYLIGGYPGGSRMRVYDSSTNTWTPAGSLPETFQWGFASGIIGQALYVFGGEPNASRNAPGYKYDFVSQSWSSVARIPFNEGRGALSSGVVGDKMYVLNGNAPDGTTILQIYDSSSNSWSLGLSLSGHHFEAAAVAVEGSRVTFFGGADDHDCADSGSAAVLSDSVNVFDTVLGTWSTLPPMNLPKMWATAQFFKGKFYVLGGFDQDSFQMNDLGIYTP